MYFVEKSKGINFFKQFDYILFLSVLALSLLGLVVLSSATKVMPNGANGTRMMTVQAVSLGLGSLTAIIISNIDYKDFKSIGILLYIFSIVMLVIVRFKGYGLSTVGSNSWLSVPVIGSFQPSELAKISFILIISLFLERIKEGQKGHNILKLLVYAAVPIALILLQPDYGMAIVFVFIFFVMVFIFGIRYRHIIISMFVLLATAPFIWRFALNDKRKQRIMEFLIPKSDIQGASYQVSKSELAIGSGRIYGSGLYKGLQTQNNGVPVKESDFIFSVIGEELGFIGAIVVIILIFIILLRCLYIARNSRDLYGSYIVVGITSMLGFQFMQNIGMCLRLLPVTGLPLPFVSAGGSSLVTNFIAIGIVLSVSMRRKRTIFNSSS
jgi:rod shape determining protein RodA